MELLDLKQLYHLIDLLKKECDEKVRICKNLIKAIDEEKNEDDQLQIYFKQYKPAFYDWYEADKLISHIYKLIEEKNKKYEKL